MTRVLLGSAASIIVLGVAFLVVGGTNTGVWVLGVYARTRGGTWHQARFLCPGCSRRHHVGRPGPTGYTQCVHCAPEEAPDDRSR